jgi:hypothetical protein
MGLWSRTLFPFKDRPSQSYSPSIDVKTGSPDPADFATTRILIQIYPLAYSASTAAIATGGTTIARTANTRHLILSANCHKPTPPPSRPLV